MKIFKTLSIISSLVLVACTNEALEGGELFSQHAMLYKIDGTTPKQASFHDRTSVIASVEDFGTQKEERFVVSLAKENTQNVSIRLAINPQEVQKYNQVYGTSFLEFPSENVELTSSLRIDAGKVNSEIGSVKMLISSDMKENTPYLLAISMTSVSGGIEIMDTSKTLFYAIELVKGQITKTVKITRQEYFALEGVKTIGTTFTLEGLIWVDEFRGPGEGEAGISTFMGVEGATLLRFGDAGIDPDHLQANGQDIGVKFKTKQWYHIALVVDNSKSIAYVNGEKVMEFAKSGNLVSTNPFYIGRSYSDNRGIEARLSELRVWRTARTSQQIKDNMYEADATSADLWAYWKMNEVKNGKIVDASSNEINLVLKGQAGKTGDQAITIYEESTPVKID